MAEHIDHGGSTRVKVPDFDPKNPPVNDGDAYPAGIVLDQRDCTVGASQAECAEDVFWGAWVPFLGRKGMVPTLVEGKVTPYVNQGRWVADCFVCNGAMHCWDRNPYACCLTCGSMVNVAWQLPAVRAEVVRLLAGRVSAHRNWDAHKGETAEELALQNVLMQGVAPEQRDGLLVAANIKMPDQFAHPQDYLDHLQTRRRKALAADDGRLRDAVRRASDGG